MRGYKHERIHQCIRCGEHDAPDEFCLSGKKHIAEPMKLRYCAGFNPKEAKDEAD